MSATTTRVRTTLLWAYLVRNLVDVRGPIVYCHSLPDKPDVFPVAAAMLGNQIYTLDQAATVNGTTKTRVSRGSRITLWCNQHV
jgi:hypothetical protein